jgi:hypothetical protein
MMSTCDGDAARYQAVALLASSRGSAMTCSLPLEGIDACRQLRRDHGHELIGQRLERGRHER